MPSLTLRRDARPLSIHDVLDLQREDRVFAQWKLVIGSSSRADVIVVSPAVAPVHCTIIQDDAGHTVIAGGAEAGITIAGERIARRVLRHGDVIVLGASGHDVRFDAHDRRGGMCALSITVRADDLAAICRRFRRGAIRRGLRWTPEQVADFEREQEVGLHWQAISAGGGDIVVPPDLGLVNDLMLAMRFVAITCELCAQTVERARCRQEYFSTGACSGHTAIVCPQGHQLYGLTAWIE